jgi:hypothetical protein
LLANLFGNSVKISAKLKIFLKAARVPLYNMSRPALLKLMKQGFGEQSLESCIVGVTRVTAALYPHLPWSDRCRLLLYVFGWQKPRLAGMRSFIENEQQQDGLANYVRYRLLGTPEIAVGCSGGAACQLISGAHFGPPRPFRQGWLSHKIFQTSWFHLTPSHKPSCL